jgi:hypothetical protein
MSNNLKRGLFWSAATIALGIATGAALWALPIAALFCGMAAGHFIAWANECETETE